MRILLVSDGHLKKELGASKVVIELAEELERLGWRCQLSSLPDLVASHPGEGDARHTALRTFLRQHAAEYDVVDYGHSHLPYPRTEFSPSTLFVARSVLLAYHFVHIKVPVYKTLKARVYDLLYGVRDRARYRDYLRRTDRTLAEADLINVSNDDDSRALVRNGLPPEKIVILPYGLSREMRRAFDHVSGASPGTPTVAFVGTFDSRKGATDLPQIVRQVLEAVPNVRFRFFGTFKSEVDVLARFPRSSRERIGVVPGYSPLELPQMLAECSVGIFPSYVEGFGFGVLEMLAAGLPVIAYDAPGPPMMLRPEYLVKPGDATALARKVVELLASPSTLTAARSWAKERSQQFLWSEIARRTSDVYWERWEQKQRTLTARGSAAK
jgi:glycosyltransferase involved in cell wall biosynthesis